MQLLCLSFQFLSGDEMTTGYYIRINVEDQTGVLADVTDEVVQY